MSAENANLSAALEYLERGWSIIPINPSGTKKPLIEWREYQARFPTEEEVTKWWTEWPFAIPAIVTGALSGIYIVDCDSDAAVTHAAEAGINLRTPVQVKTRRGRHFYYAHPHDGKHRGPHTGSAGSADPLFPWPKGIDVDWRGDGAYALLPAPESPYRWEIQPGTDFDDLPGWVDLLPTGAVDDPDQPELLDLSANRMPDPDGHLSEWERAARLAGQYRGGKIPSGQGNGRNERVMRYASECIRAGHWDDLREKIVEFMDTFYADRLGDREVTATIRSMQRAERRNHPENFAADGTWLGANRAQHLPQLATAQVTAQVQQPAPQPAPPPPLIFMRDAPALEKQAAQKGILVEPFLFATGSIVQVYGYTGSGKSTFVQHLLGAACASDPSKGLVEVGPFEVKKRPRCLYLNFEEGRRTIAHRLMDLSALYGDTGDHLAIWAPFMAPEGTNPSMRDEKFLAQLTDMVKGYRPDIVVIDTVRSAWPGLEENKAEAWSPVNQLAMKLRNVGISVIILHHGNKPSEVGVGAEAGSTNQLTVIETQIRIARVYENDNDAKLHAALAASALVPTDFCLPSGYVVWDWFKGTMLRPGERLSWVFEARYRKVREPDYTWAPAYLMGFAVDLQSGTRRLISTYSPKQAARVAARQYGTAVSVIADTLGIPAPVISEWLL